MAAKLWTEDFRFHAIQHSIRRLGSDEIEDPFRCAGSFCLPVGERPMVGWTPGRVAIIILVATFSLLGIAMLLARWEEQMAPGPAASVVFGAAVCCGLAGMVGFFIPAKFDRQIVGWLIGERGRQLMQRTGLVETMSVEISSPESATKITIDGDDHALVGFDDENHRLLVEGVAARYQIRAADVERLIRYQYKNYVGADITYRIDPETTLRIIVARVSLLLEVYRQVLILSFLKRTIRNRIFESCARTLERPSDV